MIPNFKYFNFNIANTNLYSSLLQITVTDDWLMPANKAEFKMLS